MNKTYNISLEDVTFEVVADVTIERQNDYYDVDLKYVFHNGVDIIKDQQVNALGLDMSADKFDNLIEQIVFEKEISK
jgi:hypothetical protein